MGNNELRDWPMRRTRYWSTLEAALKNFSLDPLGIHGVKHWARVWHNSIVLGNAFQRATGKGVDRNLGLLFAILHDSMRESDGHDPEHGRRAVLAATLAARSHLHASDAIELNLAIALHADGPLSEKFKANFPVVQLLMDADRLDLARVGTRPHPRFLSDWITEQMIEEASERALSDFVPDRAQPWIRQAEALVKARREIINYKRDCVGYEQNDSEDALAGGS